MEEFIGHDFLDYVLESVETRARWVPPLRRTHWSSEPPEVRLRLRALLGVTDDQPSAG